MKQREGDEMRHFVIPVRRGKVRKVGNIYGPQPQLRGAIILLPNSPSVYEDRLLRLIIVAQKILRLNSYSQRRGAGKKRARTYLL
jgi:hypothetical protein